MSIIKCGNEIIETIGDIPEEGSIAPNFTVCNGDFELFNLEHDFKGKPLVLFVIPSLDTNTCMACLNHFSRVVQEKQILNYLVITSDTPFALKRISGVLPYDSTFVCSDMVLREFGEAFNMTIARGPLKSFVARAVFVLDKEHRLKHVDLSPDVSNHINYNHLEAAIDECL